jgi:hypothetical protein
MNSHPQGSQSAHEAVGPACIGRRALLGLFATGAVAAVTPAPAGVAAPDDKRKAVYRATEHVETFYRLNRY